MNLYSGTPYWPSTYDAPASPPLTENRTCDVLVIGGGSSGAQCAYYLRQLGLDVVLVEKDRVGFGSTACNTAILQYTGTKAIHTVRASIGEQAALCFFRGMYAAMKEIGTIAKGLPIDCDWQEQDSLYFASIPEDLQSMDRDYDWLSRNHFPVERLTGQEMSESYSFTRDAALLFKGDGMINPYRFTHGLLQQSGADVFEQTRINQHVHHENESVYTTSDGYFIRTRYTVFATGYAAQSVKKERGATINSTYTLVTKPLPDLPSWMRETMVWETARPYFYLRTTPDDRLIAGGMDEDTAIPAERDGMVTHKKERLLQAIRQLVPSLMPEEECMVSAFFGQLRNGLPAITEYPEWPRTFFLLAYGDNGLVYSTHLAKKLAQRVHSKVHQRIM